MPNTIIHLLSNVLLLGFIRYFDKEFLNKKAFTHLCFVVFGSNLIDLDHLLANPIYDPLRCSINFHPLHSWYALPVYIGGILYHNKFLRYFCIGVLLHLGMDWAYCAVYLN